MELLTSPQSYDICFSVASLVLILVTLFIHLSEDKYYSKQGHIFGALIIDALLLNIMGLFHALYLYNEFMHALIGYDNNCYIVLAEKMLTYLIPYLSITYLMSIFQLEPDGPLRKAILIIPTMYSVFFYPIGYLSGFFFYFDEVGKLVYIYPQAATVNIGIDLYYAFATYLLLKYTKTISSEKASALWVYYFLMMVGVPIRIVTKSSSIFEFSVSLALLLCVYTFQNPSEFVDRLTGTSTRNALNFTISTNLLQKREFTLFGIHIDRFNAILGEKSSEVAAAMVSQVTEYLKGLSPDKVVFYPNMEDFILIFQGVTPDEVVIERTAEQIRKRFKDTWTILDEEIKLYESPYAIGFPDEVSSLERYNEVRGVLDKAIVKQGKDMLRMADLNLKIVEHDKKIDSIVKHALDDGLLEVYYQPIYSPSTGRFTSCEALLRLKDPQLGFISPAILMPIAERNGTILSIDRFVIESVCEMLQETDVRRHGLDYVELNLSVVDCIQTNLYDNVMNMLSKYQVKPSEINFEITETYEQGITSVMDENITKLTEAGIAFSMDDFGTGYSNLVRIATTPVDLFKLDKSIIQSAFESETSYMVMINLIKIIKALKKEIVAEGVETGEQARQLIKLGCDHIQGFFYARPMPRDQFLQFLRDHNG